jgi:hypothetical protein
MKKLSHSVTLILLMITLWTLGCAGPGNSGAQSETANKDRSIEQSQAVRAENTETQTSSTWQADFGLSERTLLPTGRNTYFILEPGFQLILEKEEDLISASEKLAITVLDETKEVDGVTTRIVEEREWRNGNLIEVSRNFFAICAQTNDVFYFGEEVDMYKGGKVLNHEGAWLAGKKGAKAGLIMPARPVVGMKYYQEMARGVAMDRAEVIKLKDELNTPAGNFTDCLLTKEGTALNPFEREFKTYAPGIGLIQDQKLLLTWHGFIAEK